MATADTAPGSLFLVVGPSGSGKDTLMGLVRHELGADYVFVRRVITRPAGSPGEDHEAVSPDEFQRRREAGAFFATWHAHGLDYGLPAGIPEILSSGRHVVANVSRSIVDEISRRVPGVVAIVVQAPADVLARRIVQRGRESLADAERRLLRPAPPLPSHVIRRLVDNGGALAEAAAELLAILRQPLRHAVARVLPIDTGALEIAYLPGLPAPGVLLLPSAQHLWRLQVNGVADPGLLAAGELGLPASLARRMGMASGSPVCWASPAPARSQAAFRRKIRGARLDEDEYFGVFEDAVHGEYGELELASFLVAAARSQDTGELLAIARARARFGQPMRWHAPMVVDLHSIGGVPGNRITMIVVPIVAAHGLVMPKASSRAITSPAGTADAMAVLANVELGPEDVRRCVTAAGACMVWNGRLQHSVIDDLMNRITRPLGLDSARWAVASILSKKVNAGITHLVVDLPFGPNAKLPSLQDARALADLFVTIGRGLGIAVQALPVDGSQPIGRGMGPALEVRDVLQVLEGSPAAPADLRERALHFAAHLLAFDPRIGNAELGRESAVRLLESGAARQALDRIIAAQGANEHVVRPGTCVAEVRAANPGRITAMNGWVLGGIARRAGAPMHPGAGIDLLCEIGQTVDAGDLLYRIHADRAELAQLAARQAHHDCGITIAG